MSDVPDSPEAPCEFRDWIGRRESVEEILAPRRVEAMAACLDRDRWPGPGDPLPPLWHWAFFMPIAPHSALGVDGHPRRGDFVPAIPLPRRMYAGGTIEFRRPLRVGDKVRRTSEIVDVAEKRGRSGPLVFVTIRHDYADASGVALAETQDLVYREAGKHVAPSPDAAPVADPTWRLTVTTDPVLLFRYSALTFNGHRIHYDYPYATEVEGYPGLVVHGPLIATLLADLACAGNPGRDIATFRFRARSPVFCNEAFEIRGTPGESGAADLAAFSLHGLCAMEARATFR